jgi:hypothetical protein
MNAITCSTVGDAVVAITKMAKRAGADANHLMALEVLRGIPADAHGAAFSFDTALDMRHMLDVGASARGCASYSLVKAACIAEGVARASH